MDMSSVTQLLNGVNSQSTINGNQQNQAIPGAPPADQTPGQNPGTDFGAAGLIDIKSTKETVYKPDMARVKELWDSHRTQVDSFRRMIETLLNKQAEKQGLANGFSISDIEVTDEMRAQAQEMIDEGGYFSVEETAARILDFAVAISGGDPSRVDLLQSAVERGFRQAERTFGGELPEISHQTLKEVIKGFDEWVEAGSAKGIALLNRE